MRVLILPLLFLPALRCSAQQDTAALLYRIVGPGISAPSFLWGTIHSADARVFGHFDLARKAMDRCDVVVGELDASQMSASAGALMTGMLLPAGTDLDDLLTPKQYKRVREALSETLGPMAGMFERFKPLYLSALLTESTARRDSGAVLDAVLQRHAVESGRPVLGLETMREQMAAMDRIPLKEQARMLYDLVRNDLQQDEMERMIELYAEQDLPGLMELCSEESTSEAFHTGLLVDRNQVMLHRMDSLLHLERTYLFAVGALHLAGPDGLISALRAKGYVLRAVLREEDLMSVGH